MSKPTSNNNGQAPAAPAGHGEKPKTQPEGGKGAKVIALPGMCMAEECKKRAEKASFCMEHFDWFKEGLITKEGRRPTDFEKKHSDYMRRKRSA